MNDKEREKRRKRNQKSKLKKKLLKEIRLDKFILCCRHNLVEWSCYCFCGCDSCECDKQCSKCQSLYTPSDRENFLNILCDKQH